MDSDVAQADGASVAWMVGAGAAVLTVSGVVDVVSCPVLARAFDEVLGSGVSAVVVDLDRVTLLDSAGLGTLTAGRRLASARGATFRVVQARDCVARVLAVGGLLDELTDAHRDDLRDGGAGRLVG